MNNKSSISSQFKFLALIILLFIALILTLLLTTTMAFAINNNTINSGNTNIISESSVVASINKEESYSVITATSSEIMGQEIKLAVWNVQAGQARSLKWCSTNNSYNQVKFGITIKDFGYAGKYLCDAYLVDSDNMKFLGRADFNVSELSGSTPTVTDEDKSQLTFKANETNIQSCSGVTSIRFAIWSKTNGQDDLVWTNGPVTPAETGMYSSTITEYLSKHKYQNDTYYIHVYATGNNGVDSCVGTTTKEIKLVESSVTALLNTDETFSSITAASPIISGQEVRLAVWNVNAGQTLSLKWCPMFNCWSSVSFGVTISDFKYSGQYFCDAYLVNGSDMILLGRADFSISPLTGNQPTVTEKNPDSLSFKANESQIWSPSGISRIRFAIWTNIGGQDDLVWTSGPINKISDKIYSSTITEYVSNHKYLNDVYNIHVYATGKNGVETCVGTLSERIELFKDSFNANVNDEQTVATCQIINHNIINASKLEFAVWSEYLKQKDIIWYNVNFYELEGKLDVPIISFKQIGVYHVHAYITYTSGEKELLNRVDFKVQAPQSNTEITNIDGHLGTFNINTTLTTFPSSIKEIKDPTWTEHEEASKAIWYSANKESSTKYIAKANVINHDFYFGKYKIHVYAYMKNGCQVKLSENSISISPDKYLGVKRLGNTMYKIITQGVPTNTTLVKFPTWSATKDQDDLIWYEGTKLNDTCWYAEFSARLHFNAGTFHTHCYVTTSTTPQELFAYTSYTVPEEDVRPPFNPYRGITQGIDVSEHQGTIDWYTVGNSNQVGFAMIRAGFGTTRADYEFENNYINAVKTGIPVGAYWFSYARSVPEAQAEARKCLEVLGGRYFDLPIAFDLEWHNDIDTGTNTAMINAFCEIINAAGYQPMVYASEFWFNNKISINGLYPWIYLWGAKWSQYDPQIAHKERMRIWQYSDSGYVTGISGAVDMDKIYF